MDSGKISESLHYKQLHRGNFFSLAFQTTRVPRALCYYSDFNPSWIVNGVLSLNRFCVTLILTY